MKSYNPASNVEFGSEPRGQGRDVRSAPRGTYRYDEKTESIVFVPMRPSAPRAEPVLELPQLHIGQYL